MLVYKDVITMITQLLIDWKHSCQPLKYHIRKSLAYMDFNMDFFL